MKTSCFWLLLWLLLLPAAPALAQPKSSGKRDEVRVGRKAPVAKLAAAQRAALPSAPPAFTQYLHSPWVDSLMRVLTPAQRTAQLFMVAAWSNRSRVDEDSVSALIRSYGIGGVIFFQGGPVRQSRLLNRYQAESAVPLLVAMDGEWGAGMRLDSIGKFPYQMSLGALPAADSAQLYRMGQAVAGQFRRLGMHVNFAPVVDVSNNAANPVIGTRSWGENPAALARNSRQYLRGMQDAGILAVAKHFPGHGDVDADSHLALPVVRVDRTRLDSLELPPFRSMIRAGIGGMMVAHLQVPALDTARGPSTLSHGIVTGLLREQLGFRGLIFTDAMNMKGVTSQFAPGEADVRAILAGNDILEFSPNIPLALRAVQTALDSGRITQAALDEHCRRVLALKQWAGLHHYRPVDTRHLAADLNPPAALALAQRLSAESLTVLKNARRLLPLRGLDSLRIATLVIGGTPADTTAFQHAVDQYAPAAHFHVAAAPDLDALLDLREKLFPYNLILVSLQGLGRLPATAFGITPETNLLLRELTKPGERVVVSVFGSPYAVARLRDFAQADAVLLAYQESATAQQEAAQLIFGGVGARGKLPVTITEQLPLGFGLPTAGGQRLRFAAPENAGMDPRLETRIDSLMGRALAAQATPGAQVVIAHRGAVVLQKSYGNQTYAGFGTTNPSTRHRAPTTNTQTLSTPLPVRNTDLYDLASLTKVLASVPALLKLQAQGKFSPDSTLGGLFPQLRSTNKAPLKLRDVLAHQAGLPAFIPFWQKLTKKNGDLRRRWFRPDSSARFPLPAATGLWARQELPAKLYQEIGAAPLNPKPGYLYSDLSFYLYPELVQRRTGVSFERFLQQELYAPLGASTLTFRPRNCFPLARLVPTEYDSAFRRQLLHGTVDDEGAALLGGISGHAGLFGTALDVAKVAQCYAWGGRYGGQQVFDKQVLADYTRCQFCATGNRRGLGFDRPATPPAGNTAAGASAGSFGHSGFTGTYFWVDPAQELVVVVLTNRVHPSRRNGRLGALNLRTDVQQVAIECLRR